MRNRDLSPVQLSWVGGAVGSPRFPTNSGCRCERGFLREHGQSTPRDRSAVLRARVVRRCEVSGGRTSSPCRTTSSFGRGDASACSSPGGQMVVNRPGTYHTSAHPDQGRRSKLKNVTDDSHRPHSRHILAVGPRLRCGSRRRRSQSRVSYLTLTMTLPLARPCST